MNKNYEFHPADGRGGSDIGWLKSKFSFSFSNYYNPEMMGFGTLRVINDDIVAGWQGFGQHPHSNMEIVSIPTAWAVSHKDSMGNDKIIKAWEVQVMSAWRWVVHSEMNHSIDEDAKFFQIWIQTREDNIEPSYSQKEFKPDDRKDTLQLLIDPKGWDNVVKIHQDAYISRGDLSEWKKVEYKKYDSKNGVYIFLISGNIEIWDYALTDRDALWVRDEGNITIESKIKSDILIFEVPMN
jgi:redox-sensitive bicupin YhaK (pirin superfamily)